MDKEAVKEYYNMTEQFATLLYGMKWFNSEENNFEHEQIINQAENLWRKFLAFGINNVGDCE